MPIEHVILRPFSPEDISTFVRNWYVAYDRAIHPDWPDPLQAEADAKALYGEIQANPRVQSLATNPLMLTIIALIKHQNVTLPERRVQFYEMALNTLMRSWNKARSLSNRPIGEDLSRRGVEEGLGSGRRLDASRKKHRNVFSPATPSSPRRDPPGVQSESR